MWVRVCSRLNSAKFLHTIDAIIYTYRECLVNGVSPLCKPVLREWVGLKVFRLKRSHYVPSYYKWNRKLILLLPKTQCVPFSRSGNAFLHSYFLLFFFARSGGGDGGGWWRGAARARVLTLGYHRNETFSFAHKFYLVLSSACFWMGFWLVVVSVPGSGQQRTTDSLPNSMNSMGKYYVCFIRVLSGRWLKSNWFRSEFIYV